MFSDYMQEDCHLPYCKNFFFCFKKNLPRAIAVQYLHHCEYLVKGPGDWGRHGPPWWHAPAFEAAPLPLLPGTEQRVRWPGKGQWRFKKMIHVKYNHFHDSSKKSITYISVKSGEGLDHVEAMHVHNGCINCKLRADTWQLRKKGKQWEQIT